MSDSAAEPSLPHPPADQEPEAPALSGDYLPPVHPPGAGIIMQLFFIPMLIVAIIVAVWLMFSWLAHMGSRPDQMVRDFEQLNDATWQKALTLANMLRDPSNSTLRRDPQLAQRLAAVLEAQLDAGQTDTDHIWFRMYLCRALGEFEVADGLQVLLRAASLERAVEEWEVRRAALQAVGLLIGNVGASTAQQNDQLLPVLRQAAQERNAQTDPQGSRAKLRSTAAFVLGLLEGEAAADLLAVMTSDPDPFVRYNAAAGLARHGDVRAVPRLLEMLDPQNDAFEIADEDESEAQWNRLHVTSNAMRAAAQLATRNSEADLTQIETAVEGLLDTDLRGAARLEARDLLRQLQQRRQTAAP